MFVTRTEEHDMDADPLAKIDRVLASMEKDHPLDAGDVPTFTSTEHALLRSRYAYKQRTSLYAGLDHTEGEKCRSTVLLHLVHPFHPCPVCRKEAQATMTPCAVDTQLAFYDAELHALDEVKTHAEERALILARIRVLNQIWLVRRWSRFFLVVSSDGHIHGSRQCSTCRPTTAYGWLPELSGETEAEAVEAHGPALCSVCFPSAPVELTRGKVKKTDAVRAAA